MCTRIIIIFLLCIALTSCYKNEGALGDKPEVSKEDQITWIKDYAFLRCVYAQYGQDLSSEFFRNDYSASALVDISNMWGKVDEVDSLAQVFVSSYPLSPIQDYEGMRPIMMSCLTFWRSS